MVKNIIANIVALILYTLAAFWFYDRLAEIAEARALKEMMKGFRDASKSGIH